MKIPCEMESTRVTTSLSRSGATSKLPTGPPPTFCHPLSRSSRDFEHVLLQKWLRSRLVSPGSRGPSTKGWWVDTVKEGVDVLP